MASESPRAGPHGICSWEAECDGHHCSGSFLLSSQPRTPATEWCCPQPNGSSRLSLPNLDPSQASLDACLLSGSGTRQLDSIYHTLCTPLVAKQRPPQFAVTAALGQASSLPTSSSAFAAFASLMTVSTVQCQSHMSCVPESVRPHSPFSSFVSIFRLELVHPSEPWPPPVQIASGLIVCHMFIWTQHLFSVRVSPKLHLPSHIWPVANSWWSSRSFFSDLYCSFRSHCIAPDSPVLLC